jgi:hypothetical protein
MTGTEYITASVLETLWAQAADAFRSELAESKASVQDFLQRKSPAWHLVGRVHFNLAENRRDDEAPFAFLATYTTQLSKHAKAQHLPLGRALSEYAGAADKPRLLSLLLPVQRAAAECPWLNAMVEAGEIYSCPDWASMCKHVAAVLYGIGARLDHQPELLFTLRNVDSKDLIAKAGADLSKKHKGAAGVKVLASDDLSEMFGIEMAPATPPKRAAVSTVATKPSTAPSSKASSRQTKVSRPAKLSEPTPKRRDGKQRLTQAKRRAISERMRTYWAARRGLAKKQMASKSS